VHGTRKLAGPCWLPSTCIRAWPCRSCGTARSPSRWRSTPRSLRCRPRSSRSLLRCRRHGTVRIRGDEPERAGRPPLRQGDPPSRRSGSYPAISCVNTRGKYGLVRPGVASMTHAASYPIPRLDATPDKTRSSGRPSHPSHRRRGSSSVPPSTTSNARPEADRSARTAIGISLVRLSSPG
jgi:hypothetical protein